MSRGPGRHGLEIILTRSRASAGGLYRTRGSLGAEGSTRRSSMFTKASASPGGFDASGGGIRRTREGSTFELCGDVVGLHGRSMERRKGAPDMRPPRRGLPTRRQPELVVEFRGASAQGRFCHVEFCGPVFSQPGFSASGPGPIPRCVTRRLPPASAITTGCLCRLNSSTAPGAPPAPSPSQTPR
jgi:hypothetical protein